MACAEVGSAQSVGFVSGEVAMSSAKSSAKRGKTSRPTITRGELCRLAFCNSKRLPWTVSIDGERFQWVGIGWVNEGPELGDEVIVVDGD
jgi:hypothetical protein